MKQLIERLAPFIGPNATAVLTGATVLGGQLESRLATSPIGVTAIDLIEQAITNGNIMALLPAPVAGVIGYVSRRSDFRKPVRDNRSIEMDDTQEIIPCGTSQCEGEFLPASALDRRMAVWWNKVSGRFEDLEDEVGKLKHVVDAVTGETNEALAKLERDIASFTRHAPVPTKLTLDEHEQRAESIDDKVHVMNNADDQKLLVQLRDMVSRMPKQIWRFSKRSINNLITTDNPMQLITKRTLELSPFDFVVTRGLSSQSEQAAILRKRPKISWTKNSRHLYGKAVDIAVLDENGEVTWKMPYYVIVAEAFREAATELGYNITAGALDWGKDGPHIELDKNDFPDDGSLRIDDPYAIK